jgi:hypothetical protein
MDVQVPRPKSSLQLLYLASLQKKKNPGVFKSNGTKTVTSYSIVPSLKKEIVEAPREEIEMEALSPIPEEYDDSNTTIIYALD